MEVWLRVVNGRCWEAQYLLCSLFIESQFVFELQARGHTLKRAAVSLHNCDKCTKRGCKCFGGPPGARQEKEKKTTMTKLVFPFVTHLAKAVKALQETPFTFAQSPSHKNGQNKLHKNGQNKLSQMSIHPLL